jgi:hypothetical protein
MAENLLNKLKDHVATGEKAIAFPSDEVSQAKLSKKDRNLLALIQTAQSFSKIFPSEERPEGNEAYAFASMLWSMKLKTLSREPVFSPELVTPAAITYLDAIARGRVLAEFKDGDTKVGTINPEEGFMVYLNLKWDGESNNYASTALSPDYADRVVSPNYRLVSLASFFASSLFVSLMEEEIKNPTIEKSEVDEPIMPLAKKAAVFSIPKVLREHQEFRAFYDTILRMEQNPY